MANLTKLAEHYPWIAKGKPLVVSAPMMKISLAEYALATSAAGGLGFMAGGFDLSPLKGDLSEADTMVKTRRYPNLDYHNGLLPIGVGVQNWGADLKVFLDCLKAYPVAAVWFFAPKKVADLETWSKAVRDLNPAIKIWIQVGTVAEAKEVMETTSVDVLVLQGADAGGHGLARRAGIITLLREVCVMPQISGSGIPLIAAGGIMEGSQVAAVMTLGADGVCMGTRLLASHEAKISKGYQREVLRTTDGGAATIGSTVYDRARGIKGWPEGYHGRGIINQSYIDSCAGMTDEENEKLYQEEIKKGDQGWGPEGRMTTYAGTGIGLVDGVDSIENIVKEVHQGAIDSLRRTLMLFPELKESST